jgi:hypothetical protein
MLSSITLTLLLARTQGRVRWRYFFLPKTAVSYMAKVSLARVTLLHRARVRAHAFGSPAPLFVVENFIFYNSCAALPHAFNFCPAKLGNF